MERPLVVTDPSEQAPTLIREAGELAESLDVPLRVLTVVTREEFEEDAKVLDSVAMTERQSYHMEHEGYAEDVAETAVNDLLRDLDIDTTPIGRAVDGDGDRAAAILDEAESAACDYIFMTGRRRSPTGKAVFGDTAQRVILNFDGYVVTLTD